VVRVALRLEVSKVRVSSDRVWRIGFEGRRVRPNQIPATETWTFVHAGGKSIRAIDGAGRDRGVFTETFLLFPEARGAMMEVDGASYRGYFVLTARSSGLVLVNRLNLDDYVRGVVGNEIGRAGGPTKLEAQKAQAVAARTYAYKKIVLRGGSGFDLYDNELSQVYTGVAGESPAVNRAVSETAGEIVYHGGHPVEVFYSSTCGGRTSDPAEVWNGKGSGHLKSRKDKGRGGDYCRKADRYRWRVEWNVTTFMQVFSKYYPRFHPWDGKPFGQLKDVKVKQKGKSGRAVVVEVVTTSGRYRIEKDTIRWTLRQPGAGRAALWSTFVEFKVEKRDGKPAKVVAKGRGYGHGVGLCQMGAIEMSRQGKRYTDILKHYFSGIDIRRLY